MFDRIQQKRQSQLLFDEIAATYDLVYFGSSDMKESDDPLLGFTYAKDIHDDHFMHGVIADYECSLVHRTVNLSHPQHESAQYDWTIVRLKLKTSGLPHILIDAHTYDELLYKHVFAKYPKLRSVTSSLMGNPTFTEHFAVFSTPDMNANIVRYFNDTAMQHMLQNMPNYDVEIDGNEVFVVHSSVPQDIRTARQIFDSSIWVAEHVERQHEFSTR